MVNETNQHPVQFQFREETEGKRPLVIGGERIPRGETREILLDYSETYLGTPINIPVYVMRARRRGPRVFLTATIHGDELNGVGILRELIHHERPKLTRGTLIIIPIVNVYGMENHTRYLPDRRDLNRSFPGSAEGTLTSRLADVIHTEVVTKSDFGIDFHTAALRRTNFPNVRADMTNPGTRMLAQAFGTELIVHGKGPTGSLRRVATNRNVPTVILEAGEVWKIEPGVVEIGLRGIMNVLHTLGMVEGDAIPPLFQVGIKRTNWVRSEFGGILGFHARPGDLVQQGDLLATNRTIFGVWQGEMRSPVNGVVLGMTTMPAVKPGEPVYHIARLARKTYRRIKAEVEAISSTYVYNRIQDALATNIVLRDAETATKR